jgi:hypothetical protein
MSVSVDPYHRWLGIPPKHQPADYYRLLGVDRFEADPEVIADAAERQITHVRRYQLGPHSELSQRILNELGAAKACLLTPAKKAEYVYDADDYRKSPSDDPTDTEIVVCRVLRGGAWYVHGAGCRSAFRDVPLPSRRPVLIGFRMALSVSPSHPQ